MSTNTPWITTFSGRQFYITRAMPSDIYIEDIAHGLSNICRYVGQCRTFYSVAEHSVRMAEMALSPRMKLLLLLHDAPEAYLGDLSSKVKSELPAYRTMEAFLLSVIYCKYGLGSQPLTDFEAGTVKSFDESIRTPEVLSLFPAHDGWVLKACNYGRIWPWSHKKAEKKFLKMFRRLYEHSQHNR